MSLDFIAFKEQENILPIKLEGKEQYYLDLINIEHSWTGRTDVFWSNNFFKEAVQLVINAITLFEKGYFDCAFYSLRQSLELSTTVVYFVDDCEDNRKREIRKWKNQDRFPMNKQMITDLQNRQAVFADIKDKMMLYFQEIEETKQKLNKYVHKQGYDKFYISRNNPILSHTGQEKLLSDFDTCLIKCMGAIAVFRLAIDPFPLLLADEAIYNRTRELMTEGYTEDFVEKYIGINHIEAYKQTELYKSLYEEIIAGEEMLPAVVNVVKNDYVDRTRINEILSQRHLLSDNDLVAVALMSYSNKIAKVYCTGGLDWYFTDIQSKRKKMSWSSKDFDIFKDGSKKYNVGYDEAFLSHISVLKDDYYIEHNEEFTESEISELDDASAILSKVNAFPPSA
jgi:hypothetical protein